MQTAQWNIWWLTASRLLLDIKKTSLHVVTPTSASNICRAPVRYIFQKGATHGLNTVSYMPSVYA